MRFRFEDIEEDEKYEKGTYEDKYQEYLKRKKQKENLVDKATEEFHSLLYKGTKNKENSFSIDLNNNNNELPRATIGPQKDNNVYKDNQYNRKVQEMELPKANIGLANPEETKNATVLTAAELKARERAKEKNRNIAKGGVDAFNEYMDSALNAIPSGVMNVASGLGNVVTTGTGLVLKGINNIAHNDEIDKMYDNVIKAGKDIHETGNYYNKVNSMVEDDFTRNSANVINTVSQMLSTAGAGKVIGVPGAFVQGLYVGGNSAQEVLNENKDNIVQAGITGLGKGYVSYLTEKMFDANILTKGMNKTSIQNSINDMIFF